MNCLGVLNPNGSSVQFMLRHGSMYHHFVPLSVDENDTVFLLAAGELQLLFNIEA